MTRELANSNDGAPSETEIAAKMGVGLDTAIQTLPVRYQKVVVLYYSNEMAMKEIGGVLGINESRVSQIHKTALGKMATALQPEDIHSSEALV